MKKSINYISNLSLVKPNLNINSNIDLIHKEETFTKANVCNGVKDTILKGKR